MAKNKVLWLLVPISLLFFELKAQEHRFMVFFTEKNSSFSTSTPSEFLSERAINRRTRQNIAITEQDLPVSDMYIASLKEMGVIVWYTTKWFNGAMIQTDSSKLDEITGLSFVSSIEFIAPSGLKPQNSSGLHKKNQNIQQGRTQSTEAQNKLIGIDLMQQEGISGSGMLIAVFDGGFLGVDQIPAFSHLTDNGQLLTSYDFVGNSPDVFKYDDHGTKVLSVIGANNPGVFLGSAFNAEFILCVTEEVGSEYRVEEYNWLFAAELADSAGVDIINTSLGYNIFDDPNMNYQLEQLDGSTPAISRAASIAATKGMVLTISAGNAGGSPWRSITTPADAFDALVVGAITQDSSKAVFSSTGPTADGRIKPDVVALGVSTAVINRNGNVVFNNGTSFSAPQLAGLAAGVWQANPDYDYLQVIEAIKNAGHMSQNPDNQIGHGIPNYARTKQLVLSVDDPEENNYLTLYPNPVGNQLFIISEVPIPSATVFIHNISGQKLLENQLNNIQALTEVPIDIPLFPKGIYLVTVLSEEGSGTFRLIKQ